MLARAVNSSCMRLLLSLSVLAASTLCLPIDIARCEPAWDEPVGPTVVDTGSRVYDFSAFTVDSADGQRRYQIQIASPKRPPPANGYPVAYVLDGNASIAALDEALLTDLDAGEPPVIVAIGYVDTKRFNAKGRAYDYTPRIPQGQAVVDDIGRPGGGADLFLDLIDARIKPRVTALTVIDQSRQALWGHSFGGVLALYAAFTRPGSFQRYAAASPALWWNYGAILQAEPAFLKRARPEALRIDLTIGELEQRPRKQNGRATSPMRESLPPGSTQTLARRLSSAGIAVSFTEFPGIGHGPSFNAALVQLLRDLANARDAQARELESTARPQRHARLGAGSTR